MTIQFNYWKYLIGVWNLPTGGKPTSQTVPWEVLHNQQWTLSGWNLFPGFSNSNREMRNPWVPERSVNGLVHTWNLIKPNKLKKKPSSWLVLDPNMDTRIQAWTWLSNIQDWAWAMVQPIVTWTWPSKAQQVTFPDNLYHMYKTRILSWATVEYPGRFLSIAACGQGHGGRTAWSQD